MALTPELVALIIYGLDRAFELYEKQGMTKEEIKEKITEEIKLFYSIKDQIKSEIDKYGG